MKRFGYEGKGGRVVAFFDFLTSINKAKYNPKIVNRLNKRREFIVEPFKSVIGGGRVLDLASHDGRWCYAFAGAGAAEVVGIEGRKDLVEQFISFPDTSLKQRVKLSVGDIFAGTQELVARGEYFDVVGVLGIYYHIMDHFGLLKLIRSLKPKLIIIDSTFVTDPKPLIHVGYEDTDKDINAVPQVEDQKTAVIGIVSLKAQDMIAGALGYRVEWLDWGKLPTESRDGLEDYFREGRIRRFTCALWPTEQTDILSLRSPATKIRKEEPRGMPMGQRAASPYMPI